MAYSNLVRWCQILFCDPARRLTCARRSCCVLAVATAASSMVVIKQCIMGIHLWSSACLHLQCSGRGVHVRLALLDRVDEL